ncbi:ArgS-related anticodon-binding protein NrtL [Streptomyces roseicoloratus]|uniref:arginine--tRNA ligase n=1 Tax=Streptomyces roseicoloratus TaxID=2508722 RepID=A0ABY9RTG8_9ACTN|nr:DALR anticodon-binding domain-containing protein [Streptomyces roseicoloratus]WMX45038.1 DALR anticodon-binding domain-containing protein [Streptomyces roseicoloratus]
MTPADLSLTVLHAVRRAVDEGVLDVDVPESVHVERPRAGGRGDYASSVALVLARGAGVAPRQVADVLVERLLPHPALDRVDVTGPGFLNFTLRPDAQQELVRTVLRDGIRYGHQPPNGGAHQPVHRADVRAAVTADALRRILCSQGYVVRVACEGAVESAWGLLGALTEAGGARGHLPTTVAPLPVPYDAAELHRRLGADAARWGLLSAAAHDPARVGDELLRQHEGNAFFRVRYAHSRARALSRNAAQLGFRGEPVEAVDAPTLAALLRDHPAVLASAARLGAPDRVARHLEAVADALLAFQHTVLPLGDEKPSAAHRSRLALAEAAGTVLAGGLSLLGISAPDQI